ncbi:MAG: hypothetical protein K1X94_11220 [Sandaracinaceae bacterium]|nr:hypothetical protein [Sandaracinaceae bacterium]
MPKYSGVTFSVQPVDQAGKVSGFVVSGFFTKKQLAALRSMVDDEEYQRSKKWRGEYMEMARAMVEAIDRASR